MKTMFYSSSLLLALSLTFSSCDSGSTEGQKNDTSGAKTEKTPEAPATPALKLEDLVDLDLSSKGIPAIIKAPKDAKIKEGITSKSVVIDGGKNFRLDVSFNSLFEAKDEVEGTKKMETDKALYTTFDKLVYDEANGFMTLSTAGEKSFLWVLSVKEGGIVKIKSDRMSLDLSTGKFTYSPEDAEVMWQAAKLAKVTK